MVEKHFQSAMNTIKKLLTFFLCNAIGFAAPPFVYWLILRFEILDIHAEGFDVLGFYSVAQEDVLVPIVISQPLLTWMACALFSLAVFFVKKKSRIVFYLAPIILPTLHALILTFKFV
jgi:energy-coupling factor transporter transmembrane protein EcfT